ncbi:MAG TPA: radical SAM protein, partial [Patescibacteria group bacterium]|nr:radical SAM protein [Patescibacteria group bacterium]
REAKGLAKGGITHIILLGQNVNSYGLSGFMSRDLRKNRSPAGKLWTPANPSPFVKLLKRLDKVPKLEKITFLSPNPQDMSGDLIDWMKKSPKYGRGLNLPLQSGSDQVLKRMNRRYSQRQYLALVKRIRRAVPGIFLSTDIIVGFPGETKSDFLESKKVAKICGFQKAFIAMYSPRAGTAAAKMPDDVPRAEKKRRWEVLEKMINQRSNHENTRE